MNTDVMLERLIFNNFRCFDAHEISFSKKSLIVGKNNAGKSTCIEGLRLISLVSQRLGNLNVKEPPTELNLGHRIRGVSPSLSAISIQKECIFHRYGSPPSKIEAQFSNNASIELYIGSEAVLHAVIRDSKGNIARTKPATQACGIPKVGIMPQIGPLLTNEILLEEETVRRNLQTNLASIHFRNQIYLLKRDYYDSLCEQSAATWPGLKIERLDVPNQLYNKGEPIALLVREKDFTAEIAWMGHGLQMWLQTMWFIVRSRESSILILDEPDVYMHADLQRRLARLLLNDSRQFVIATHSAEIMAEVEPSSVIILDRNEPKSKPASSNKAVQVLLENIGSIHNLNLARLGIHKKILFVEGKDIPVLKRFQNILNPQSSIPIDSLPNAEIGGWSKWPSVLTIAKFFNKNTPEDIQVFCVLDSDYHTVEEISKRKEEAVQNKIHLTVWQAKELENYIIHPNPISKILNDAGVSISCDEVQEAIRTVANDLREETVDSVSEAIRVKNPKLGINKTNPLARDYVKERERTIGLEMIVNGKALFAGVVSKFQAENKESFSLSKVQSAMGATDIHADISKFIDAIGAVAS